MLQRLRLGCIQHRCRRLLGQSIKVEFKRYGAGSIGVDDIAAQIGSQSIVVPGWEVTGAVDVVDEGNGNHYVSTTGSLTSEPLTLDSNLQQISLRYRGIGSTVIDRFIVKLLRGTDFAEEVTLTNDITATTDWQTLKIGLNSYAGETVKLKLQRRYGTIHFDDVGQGEIVLQGWHPTTSDGIATATDPYGSHVISSEGDAFFIRSALFNLGLLDHPNRIDARYYAIAFAFGQSGSLLQVFWVNEQGDSYNVMQAAGSTTDYQERYFRITESLGTVGRLVIKMTGGGKVYSVADNIARQHLNEPFSYKVGVQIDTSTGAFGYQTQDLRVEGNTPLIFKRYYNGHSDRLGPMGYGWSHSYETRLVITDDDDAGVVFGSGKEVFFTWSGSSQTFTPADARIYDELLKNGDGSYTFVTKTNQRYHFTSTGVLSTIQDSNHNTVTLSYTGNGQLSTVSAQGGATFTLAYDGNGRLATVTDPVGAVATYTYDGNGDLVTAARSDAGSEQYTYDVHRLSQVTDPTGHVLFQNTFDVTHRVTQQTDALGKTLTIQYSTPAAGVTAVTDPEGGQVTTTNRSVVVGYNI